MAERRRRENKKRVQKKKTRRKRRGAENTPCYVTGERLFHPSHS